MPSRTSDGDMQKGGNPFWSERAQLDYVVRQSRPQGLPEQSPGTDDLQPLDTTHLGQCVGKGRGQSSAKPVVFTTPPSKGPGLECTADGTAFRGKKTEGRVPKEPSQFDVKLDNHDVSGVSGDDSLQRALEIEVVNHLREQNAKLMSELEWYRQQKSSPESGDGSTQSWVKVPGDGMRDGKGDAGVDGREFNTPRNDGSSGMVKNSRYTTRVPDNTPPMDVPHAPEPPALPPVQLFPTTLADDVKFGDVGSV